MHPVTTQCIHCSWCSAVLLWMQPQIGRAIELQCCCLLLLNMLQHSQACIAVSSRER